MPIPAALLFDLDGTLVDSARMIAAALSQLAATRGGQPVDVDHVRRLVSKGASILVRDSLGSLAVDSEADVAAFRAILAKISADPVIIYDGVRDMLDDLVGAGHPCAVVTNKPQHLAVLLLDQLELRDYFGAVVGGDTLASCKPDPAPLLHALGLMEAQGGPAIMIGDSEIDARAAAAAGLPFLLYEQGYESHLCGPAFVSAAFSHFRDLPAIVRGLAAGARSD